MSGIRIAIDRGGTFTDVIANVPNEKPLVFKLLSVDPSNYDDAPTEGIRRVLNLTGDDFKPGDKIKLDRIESIRMGTTVATNALLERKGAKTVLLTTKGFRDVLEIGTQTRPNIFDITAKKLSQLYSKVVEIDERVTMEGYTEDGPKTPIDMTDEALTESITKEVVRILKTPEESVVNDQLQAIWDQGFRSIAVCLLHSYAYPAHEQKIAQLARKKGFQVSVSVELQPMIGIVPRASSTVVDAYLLPIIQQYLESFTAGFEGGSQSLNKKLLFMQSDGGLCNANQFTGLHAMLSGPAGGMVGYAQTCYDDELAVATLGFDMGGTSTDVSRYDGRFEHIFETVVDQVFLNTPQLDINTVAAGGGSILFWRNNMFVVGPESASAHPGPACYRKGGPLTVTDANLFLGRLVPEYFPSIFGPNENEPLDQEIVKVKFEELTKVINLEGNNFTAEEVASGFLKVANEAMSRPIRGLTEGKGFNTKDHNLASFGGAAGQHAVAIARNLDINNVAIHKYSSLLSAYGIALADITLEKLTPIGIGFNDDNLAIVKDTIEELKSKVVSEFDSQGYNCVERSFEVYLNMKYLGSDTHLMILKPESSWDFGKAFIDKHNQEFGFLLQREVYIADCRVRLIAKSSKEDQQMNPFKEFRNCLFTETRVAPSTTKKVYFSGLGWCSCPVFEISSISQNLSITGPALIIDNTQTVLVEPKSTSHMLNEYILITVEGKEEVNNDQLEGVDPIQLSVFAHRFMSIAEQMGKTLQKISISTNIKERLDFSCAIFGSDGTLVANAPHVPAHLGAMSYAVKAQYDIWKGRIKKGDVFISNHPTAGGSHLPDVTVITPVLDDEDNVLFWTAARGHHADIGGIAAGSMPPFSKEIWQEGASILSEKLCNEGIFDEEKVIDLFFNKPAQFPGCSGTRTLADNISDLRAQVSANFKGVQLINQMIDEFSFPVVERNMKGIQNNAELAVRNLLKFAFSKFGGEQMHASDHLDDGTLIDLTIDINGETGDAVFDFTGSGDQVYGNLNTPKAVLYSAVIYVLRCLVSADIPLNHGCLIPIDIKVRDKSILSPSPTCATVGGNVETVQRVTDVILKAFQAAAASQGTCNNLTFGVGEIDENKKFQGFGYYETIAGGGGAGPSWNGQAAVQCHTTNTRITDSESFERRYPVILEEYSIRRGSGGDGYFKGGDGTTRRIKFLIDLELSVMMERRSIAPFGLKGGEDGERGTNFWFRKQHDGSYSRFSLGGRNTINLKAGDKVEINTPSGGGYGDKNGLGEDCINYLKNETFKPVKGGSLANREMSQLTN